MGYLWYNRGMQNLLDNLKTLLQKDERLVSEGELLKNKVIELALKLDEKLIDLLLSDKQMKEVFFRQVGNTIIFDKDKFIKFVSNKQFLPDSYTSFKNKVGLTVGDEFISERKEVVLSWPYKDCILEGGMTKEDQKRDEIFWNETLAPDEISRLLDPKVFTSAKRIDRTSDHKFDKFKTDENGDIKDNFIIKGNNLLALHSLKKRFAGKIKLIYIDPPYNTGGSLETFTYNNSFNHSTWLTFIKNRLEIARSLLTEDGFIAIAIDHNELFYLGELADEIFGRDNRLGVVCVLTNPRGRQFTKFFSVTIDFMLVYAKDKEHANFNKVAINIEKKQTFNLKDEQGKYRLENFIRLANIEEKLRNEKENYFYPIFVSPDLEEITLEQKRNYVKVLPVVNGKEKAWQLKKDTFAKNLTSEDSSEEYIAAKDENGNIQIYKKYREQQMLVTHWFDKKYNATFYGTRLLEKLLGRKLRVSFPKSLYTVVDVLKIITKKNDIVLDFFAGSGTTGHATLELNKEDGGNRKFILVEQLSEHIKDCNERIYKVIKNQNIHDDFVYMELAKWNENFVEKIQKAKTKEELKKLWKTMEKKAFLSYKIDIKTIDEHAKDFTDLSIEDQKRFLLECLDKNHLYINYSEIDDEEYGVSEEDKKINKEFYKS
ncbi:MAG: site-specific DNA-methyltransferase [Candidatus Pacebacteria bacterium]|nr:site-specific DNA-methyltransferase [Candidatus Paceibacterota bacterium]